MQVRLSQIAPQETRRDAGIAGTGFADSPRPGTLCAAASARFLRQAAENPAIAAVVVPESLAGEVPERLGVVVHDDPQRRFYELHNALVAGHGMGRVTPSRAASARIHPSAILGDNLVIGENVEIGPGAVVDNAVLEAGVAIGPGALVGVDGHFFKDFGADRIKVAHGGLTHLHEGAQVLAGAIVQRAVFDDGSAVGRETVIGPRVLVAHGVSIGARCILAGGAQVAGFTTIGDNVWIGPGAVISNLLTIGDGARIEVGAVVAKSVPPGQRQSGAYAAEHVRNLRFHADLWRSS